MAAAVESSSTDSFHGSHGHGRTRTFSSCLSASSDDQTDNMDEQKVLDVTIDFLYKPRSLTMLFALVVGLLYIAFTRDVEANQQDNFWHGCIGIVAVFSVISVLVCPNGPFVRPHPAVWRLILGIGILYLLLLAFVLFQSYRDVREMLSFIDPELRDQGPDTTLYDVDCANLTLIWSRCDVFVVAHFAGWAVKAVMIRHAGILWLLSLMWEVTEIAFAHLLANFSECWWDSILLDVLLCNGLGIYFGLWLCKKLEIRKYYWESIKDIRGTSKKIRRAVLQFTPISWTEVQWMDPKSSFMRYIAIGQLCVLWQVSELNTFFLKDIFLVPTKHYLNLYRLILISLMTAPTLRQYYVYVTDTRVKRLGTQAWVFICVTVLEALVCIVHGKALFSRTNLFAIALWIVFQFIVCCFAVYLMIIWRKWRQRRQRVPTPQQETPPQEPIHSILKNQRTSPRAQKDLRFANGQNKDSDDADDEEMKDEKTKTRKRRVKRTTAKQ